MYSRFGFKDIQRRLQGKSGFSGSVEDEFYYVLRHFQKGGIIEFAPT